MFRGSSASLYLLLLPLLAVLSACGGVTADSVQPAPEITFSAAPATINAGDTATLSWKVTAAKSVSIDQGVGSVAASGTAQVSPQSTTTYTLTAIGVNGPVTATATVTVNGSGSSPAPTLQLTVDNSTISAGQSATLSWNSTNATSITIDNGVGSVTVPSGSKSVSPAATTTYTATATGPGGTTTAAVTITVGSGGGTGTTAPTITLTADHTSITVGQSATLSWNSTDATSITIDNGIGSVTAPSGSKSVSPTATTTYTATATGPGGTATATVTITVTAAAVAPTVELSANSTSITAGDSVTLSWNSTNATSVTIDNGIGSVTVPSGTTTIKPTATTTYTATATGAGGTTQASVTITVTPAAPPSIASFTASPSTINKGDLSTLSWQTSNSTSVTISPSIPAEDSQPLAVSGSTPVSPASTITYTLTATGPGGSATAKVTVTVNIPAPTITLTATPTTVASGGTSTLSWSSTNADTITIDNGVGSVAVPSGKQDVTPTATTTYTATAKNSAGVTATASVTVTVTPALQVTLTTDKTQIAWGDTATLSWTTQGATSLDIEPGIGQVTNLNGSQSVQPQQTTTYTATAKDSAGNTQTASVKITVVPAGSLTSIKHIIFFLQENRSFDNYFGMLGQYKASKGLPNDVDGLDPSTMVQRDQKGVAVHPYHQITTCAENTSPSWNPSWHAFDNGAMDGFITAHDDPTTIDPEYHRVMAYYDQRDLPYYYELATQFATSDRWFSPVMSNTIPNRMYVFGATSAGHIYPDPPPQGGFPIKTIFDELQAAGVSWAYYYMDNSVFLAQFQAWNDPAIRSHVQNIQNYYNILNDPNADTLLPQVVFIERGSSSGLDEHPDSNTQKGAAVAAQIINALLNSTAWPTSVFIHTYDEFGGLYDHVAPIAAPPPDNIAPILEPGTFDTNPYPNGNFAQTGFRIPVIVISPWVKPGYVSHVPRDTTSILKFIEKRFGLPALTARDAWADDMSDFFDFSHPSLLTPPALPVQPTDETCDHTLELNGSQ